MRAPDEYIIECATELATTAFRAGRRDEQPDADDMHALQDHLEAQPDEGDRRVFDAVWGVHMRSLLEAEKRAALPVVVVEKRRPAGFGTEGP